MDERNVTMTDDLWTEIARRYRDEPTVLGYDLLDEPLPEEWQHRYADELVEVYRRLTADIRAVVDEALGRAPALLTLRLDEVERFDAAGVGLLLRLQLQARRQGTDLVCTHPPYRLVVALHRTRALHVLTVPA